MDNTYWEENSNIQQLKYESCNSNDADLPRLKDEPLYRCCDNNLNFSTVACSEDDSEYNQYKKNKVSRQDPMSHRIIEKRRRDRMNNCLADLSRLIPTEYLKKGRGRIEKTEIIEMAIRHIKYLQQAHRSSGRENAERTHGYEQYRLGYQECMSETMRFLVEVEGYFAREALCVRLIGHLQKHCETLLNRDRVNPDGKLQVDKEYSTMSIPTISLNNGNSSARQSNETLENGSQLRDMLTNNVKDEIRVPGSPQILRPISPCVREDNNTANNFTQLPMNDQEKHYTRQPCNEENQKNGIQESTESANNNNIHITERVRNISETETYSNGVSLYKFKNNIKQRFSQDLTAESTNQNANNKLYKRRKVADSTRRTSITTETYSSENHSSPMDSSQYSPPSSELYRISSESENRISPTGSSVSDFRHSNRYNVKPENNTQKSNYDRFYPTSKQNSLITQNNEMEKTNFSVPIFALHAKGSFYIPLTIDYQTLVPYLHHHNILDILPNVHNIILHPVTINVNFQSNYFNNNSTLVKNNKQQMDGQNGWH